MFFSGELLASWKLWRDTSYSGCTKLSPSLPIVISARNIVLWNTASIPYPGSTWSKTCSVLGDKKNPLQYNSIQIQFRFTSDPVQNQLRFRFSIQTSLSIGRLQLITTTLVDLNYCWQYEPMTELCAGGIYLVAP
ncbi:hypothetical protein ACN38_g10566 [Penicillium nordicum]|uniref:Uncharacterized protein n=1 Tax=Penicillium nordicum TaxID=229535 RepID=A0A0M9WBW5_9EURO|nr:hypothetical protein ACN38_g10566 [Penicillium nordicum]